MKEFTEQEINTSEYLLVAAETGGMVASSALSNASKADICVFILYCVEFSFEGPLTDLAEVGRKLGR